MTSGPEPQMQRQPAKARPVFGFFAIILTLFLPSAANAAETPVCDDFGFLMLSQIWPPSECMREPDHNTCGSMENVARWIVHGLWPDYNTPGKYPSFCEAPAYSGDAIVSMTPALERQWPNLIFDAKGDKASKRDPITDPALWRHEWEKHGTCAMLCDGSITSQEQYFQLTLDLFDRFDLEKILEAAGLVPAKGRLISTQAVVDAVKSSTGSTPALACNNDTSTETSYLLEIRICLEPGGHKVIDCPADNFAEFVCPASIVYPVHP